MPGQRQISYDVDGYDKITSALLALVNQFPDLHTGEKISFADLDEARGKALVPSSGSAIERERKYISGLVLQTCVFPFTVYYRASNMTERRRLDAQEWLDKLGRWLERQPITVGGTTYKLSEYPVMQDGRKWISLKRATPAGCAAVYENGAEDWTINLQLRYEYEFNQSV